MKRTFSLAILMMIMTASLYAQKTSKIPSSINIQNLSQIQEMPKSMRDSMVRDFKKMGTITSTFKKNGKDITQGLSSSSRIFTKEMSNLLVQVLENPNSALIEKNQSEMNALMDKMDKSMEDLDYKLEKQDIKDEYKRGIYDDRFDKRDAKRDMREDLHELKQERREEKRELRKEKREERKDMRD